MKAKPILTLYKNSRGAVSGDFYKGKKRLLATTHPATIAAAFFSMNECSFVFKSKKGKGEFEFPIDSRQLNGLAKLVDDQNDGDFLSGFATFSQFDFVHPAIRHSGRYPF